MKGAGIIVIGVISGSAPIGDDDAVPFVHLEDSTASISEACSLVLFKRALAPFRNEKISHFTVLCALLYIYY